MTRKTTAGRVAADFLTVAAAAQLLQVDRRTVGRMVQRGTLAAHRATGATGETPPMMILRTDALQVLQARAKLTGDAAR